MKYKVYRKSYPYVAGQDFQVKETEYDDLGKALTYVDRYSNGKCQNMKLTDPNGKVLYQYTDKNGIIKYDSATLDVARAEKKRKRYQDKAETNKRLSKGTRNIGLRLPENELELLDKKAKEYGFNRTDFLKKLIHDACND